MDKLNLELSSYDVSMLFGLILLGRRYGDMQTADWAGELREKVRALLDQAIEPEDTITIKKD